MSDILVLGAGELGGPIINHLIKIRTSDIKISVLVRPSTLSDPANAKTAMAKHLESNKVTRVGADTSRASVSELAGLFRQYDTIVSASGMAAKPGTQLKLAQAVLAAGVKHYIRWQFGLDYDPIGKEEHKTCSMSSWSTGIFMTFLFEEAFGVVENLRGKGKPMVRGLGSWENKVTYTHPEDVGRVTAATVLEDWEQIKNGVVFSAGDTVTFEEVAERVQATSGVPNVGMDKELWDLDQLKRDLQASPEDGLRKYRVVLAEGRGVAWDKETSWNALKGIRMITVNEFSREIRNPP